MPASSRAFSKGLLAENELLRFRRSLQFPLLRRSRRANLPEFLVRQKESRLQIARSRRVPLLLPPLLDRLIHLRRSSRRRACHRRKVRRPPIGNLLCQSNVPLPWHPRSSSFLRPAMSLPKSLVRIHIASQEPPRIAITRWFRRLLHRPTLHGYLLDKTWGNHRNNPSSRPVRVRGRYFNGAKDPVQSRRKNHLYNLMQNVRFSTMLPRV